MQVVSDFQQVLNEFIGLWYQELKAIRNIYLPDKCLNFSDMFSAEFINSSM